MKEYDLNVCPLSGHADYDDMGMMSDYACYSEDCLDDDDKETEKDYVVDPVDYPSVYDKVKEIDCVC